MPELGLYVYGLVRGGELAQAPELPGIDGSHAVECVTHGDICALVSRVPLDQFDEQPLKQRLSDLGWVEQAARRHQGVLDAVLEQCTPLPMRLCTLYSDEQRLRQMLERRHEDLSASLTELSGKLEWGVQAFVAERPRAGEHATPGDGAPSGTAYLQSRLAARRAVEHTDAELELACERLHADLSTIALDSRFGAAQRPEVATRRAPMILNAFYLVPNEHREEFRGRVAELDAELREQGVELQLTGPWPPYNFVNPAAGETAVTAANRSER